MPTLWQYYISSFPLDLKSTQNELSCQHCLLFHSGLFALWLGCLWPSCPLFSLIPLCDKVLMVLEWGRSYPMCCTFDIWWRGIALYTNICTAHTHPHTKIYELTLARKLFISLVHVQRGRHSNQFHGVLFWIKRGCGQHRLNSKCPSWQHEPLCVL